VVLTTGIRLRLAVKRGRVLRLLVTVKTVVGSMLVIMTTLSGIRLMIETLLVTWITQGTTMLKLISIWLTLKLKLTLKMVPGRTTVMGIRLIVRLLMKQRLTASTKMSV
jgi:hypothetical protein